MIIDKNNSHFLNLVVGQRGVADAAVKQGAQARLELFFGLVFKTLGELVAHAFQLDR